MNKIEFLRNHLNVWWLRPESALWDAIASTVISGHKIVAPSADLGCGNGIFSFITAGGKFSLDYDWFRNVDFSKEDMYDVSKKINVSQHIERAAKYKFDWGIDVKSNLLDQAKGLNFYKNLKLHDISYPLPFEDESLNTVFSNIIYWLRAPEKALKEIYRALNPGGKALLCIPSEKFYDFCPSYKWKNYRSKLHKNLMKAVNLERDRCILHAFTATQFSEMARRAGFTVVDCRPYLSPLTLKVWDVGLRPLSRPLIKMANKLSPKNRREIKDEWIDTCMKYLALLYQMEFEYRGKCGFYLFALRK